MDPVTHTLAGVALAGAFYRDRHGPRAIIALALASNLPDIDAAAHLVYGVDALLLRRTFGHSLLLLPIWTTLLAGILARLLKSIPFRTHLGMAAIGAGVHLLLDLINSYGVVLLWPAAGWRPELAIAFIIDFILTGLLGLPLLAALAGRARPHLARISRGALAAAGIYLAVCAAARWRATGLLEAELAGLSRDAGGFTYVFPEPLGPHRWRGVARRENQYDLWLVNVLTGSSERKASVATELDDPAVRSARASAPGGAIERFFKAPVWRRLAARADGSVEVEAHDLRFRSLVLDRGAIFRFRLRVRPDGTVERTPNS